MKIGLYLCECSGHISDRLDLPGIRAEVSAAGWIAYVKTLRLLCSGGDLAEDLCLERPDRVVIAACSPVDREELLRRTLEESGINPYLMQMANIREQVAWVTPDRNQANRKATALINAAIARVARQQPLEKKSIGICPDVMVIGAGPAGLGAALSLAEAGRSVAVVEHSPAAGGKPALFDELFPDMECGPCIISPLINEALQGEFAGGLELLTLTRLVSLRGYFGNFTATLERRPRYVDESLCISCGDCVEACPVSFCPEAVRKPGKRKAMDFLSPGALPHVPLIDMDRCLRSKGQECSKCRDACPVEGAVFYDDTVRSIEKKIGAIVVATGASQLDCSRFERLGYGRNPDVIDAMEFEQMLESSGPRKGRPVTSSFKAPDRVAIIQCVGSLDPGYKPYCSAVCCRYALKYSAMIRKRLPDAEVLHLIKEWCLPGQSAAGLLARAVNDSRTKIVRYGDPASVKVTVSRGRNRISFRDEAGSLRQLTADLVVLCPAIVPGRETGELAGELGIDCDEHGFFRSLHESADSVGSAVRGIYAAGACSSPKDIRSSANEGRAAAGRILAELKPGGVLEISPEVAVVDNVRCTGCMLCRPLCPFKAISGGRPDGRAEIIQELCRGCGICAASCPAGAIECRQFSSDALIAEIKGILDPERR